MRAGQPSFVPSRKPSGRSIGNRLATLHRPAVTAVAGFDLEAAPVAIQDPPDLFAAVDAGAERAVTRRGEHHAPHVVVVAHRPPQLVQLVGHARVERVEHLGTVQRDGRHPGVVDVDCRVTALGARPHAAGVAGGGETP